MESCVENKMKILIVDDERTNINTLTTILKPAYTVYIAKDGPTALHLAQNNHLDLILLDIIMPGMSGFEVMAALQASTATRHIPVIFITGRDNLDDEEKGLLLGAVDYIGKPFRNSIVQARVRTHMQLAEHIKTIERLSMIDPLTDLPNRRCFDDRLGSEWGRALREKNPISLLVIDIDLFKQFNDRYGHKQGDALLQALAKAFVQTVRRSSDCIARWGGEEFTALLPNTDLEGALIVAEELRTRVHSVELTGIDCSKPIVTISIGINTTIPTQNQQIDEFFTLADRALYAAKDAGRNTVRYNTLQYKGENLYA